MENTTQVILFNKKLSYRDEIPFVYFFSGNPFYIGKIPYRTFFLSERLHIHDKKVYNKSLGLRE